MSDKKPVWVDEEAHVILKTYSKLTKESMVDVASRLVLENLKELSPSTDMAPRDAAPASSRPPATRSAARASSAPAAVSGAVAPVVPRKKIERDDRNVTYLGGVWLV